MNKYEKAYNELWSVLHNEPAGEIEKHSTENKKRLEVLLPVVKRAIPRMIYKNFIRHDYYKDENVFALTCPECGYHILEFNDNVDSKLIIHELYANQSRDGSNSFCSKCGQALDWGEDDDGE